MGTHSVLEDLIDLPFQFREVHLSYSAPEYKESCERLFKCPVLFDAHETSYIIDDRFLNLRLPRSNPINYRIARQHCEKRQKKVQSYRHDDIKVRIQQILSANEGRSIDLEAMAEALNMSARTIRRKLSEESTSYRELVNLERKSRALDYLQNSALDFESIAALLGFADTANFRKAFKRWTGQSPREYQEQQGRLTATPLD